MPDLTAIEGLTPEQQDRTNEFVNGLLALGITGAMVCHLTQLMLNTMIFGSPVNLDCPDLPGSGT